jgi:hypothetical protein
MNNKERKQLQKKFEQRILAGQHKADIYAEYPDPKDAKIVTMVLSRIPIPKYREKFRVLNWVLVAIIGLLTVLKLLAVLSFVLTEMPQAGILMLLVMPIINIFVLWMLVKFDVTGYLCVIILGLNTLFKMVTGSEPIDNLFSIIAAGIIIASIALAFILLKVLLPQSNFIVPKKDAEGRPIFEK